MKKTITGPGPWIMIAGSVHAIPLTYECRSEEAAFRIADLDGYTGFIELRTDSQSFEAELDCRRFVARGHSDGLYACASRIDGLQVFVDSSSLSVTASDGETFKVACSPSTTEQFELYRRPCTKMNGCIVTR